jgi:predicted  nucleic acid-binding Zn-ribbon protein
MRELSYTEVLNEIEFFKAKVREHNEEIKRLERKINRDMLDQWTYIKDCKQFAKDLSHPVTGNVTPEESSELLIINLCKRDRGC